MRRLIIIPVIILTALAPLNAQDTTKASPVSLGMDLYSTYVWRGTVFSGPSLQPYVTLTLGGFKLGAWGSQGFDGFQEMDLFASYSLKFGLTMGITDYYYPGKNYFDLTDTSGAHGFEVNLGYSIAGFSVSGNYMLNEAGGAGTTGGDMYFELGYSISNFSIFAGAGDGWHTSDGEFMLCNIGVGATKEIKITDNFSIPVIGKVILNPEKEQFYIVAGLAF